MKLKTILISAAVLFLLAVTTSVFISKLPVFVLITYAVMSLVTFIMYWLDKSAAKKNTWRTKEKTLQLLALFGGWPGAILGQQVLRHKSKKISFQIIFWLAVIVNILFFVWLQSEQGIQTINEVQNHMGILK